MPGASAEHMAKMRAARGPRPTLEERFWAKVEKGDGCWAWRGAHDRDGYGFIKVGYSNRLATHVSLELAGRPLTDGQFALHHCDNPQCVNPAHLYSGSRLDNAADAKARGRLTRPLATHCGKGHEFTPENTWTKGRVRKCKECTKLRLRGWRAGRRDSKDALGEV
jgi:hypothetical protein